MRSGSDPDLVSGAHCWQAFWSKLMFKQYHLKVCKFWMLCPQPCGYLRAEPSCVSDTPTNYFWQGHIFFQNRIKLCNSWHCSFENVSGTFTSCLSVFAFFCAIWHGNSMCLRIIIGNSTYVKDGQTNVNA